MSLKSNFSNKRTLKRDKLTPAKKPYIPAGHLPKPIEWTERVVQLPLDTIDDFNRKLEKIEETSDKGVGQTRYWYHMPDGRRLQVSQFADPDYLNGHYILLVRKGGNAKELIVRGGYVWQEIRTVD